MTDQHTHHYKSTGANANTTTLTGQGTPRSTLAPHPTLLLTPLRAAIPAQGGTVEVLLRVRAPEQPLQSDGTVTTRVPLRLARLAELATQDVEMAQKEMLYSSSKMRARLASLHEMPGVADGVAEADMPKFLRRKLEEGKGSGTV